MRHTRTAALLLAGIAQAVFAQDVDIPFQKFVLNNGLTLIVHEDHKAPIVAVNIWYHVGSKNEKPGKTGFAHLFEHLMFGGSENFKGRYIDAMERIGATDLNGTTNNDRTNYFENVPTSALDYTLWMESDRMGHLLGSFDKQTLDLQRGVVQNEKRQGENEPYGMVDEMMTHNTYPAGHPYSWTVIGSMEDLNAASMDDVKEWFRTHYGPANAVLVVAGDIDPQVVRQKVEKYFGDIDPGPPVSAQRVWVAKMTGTHRGVLEDRVPQARIYKVWNIPQAGDEDSDQLDLVSSVLTRGKTSRFYKRLVYDDQVATDVAAYIETREIGQQLVVFATARPGTDLARVEKALDEEMARFLSEGPTAAEVERARSQYLADFVRGVDRIGGFGGKSDVLASSEVYLGSPDGYKTKLRRVREAAPANLLAASKRWLSDGVYAIEVYPFGDFKASGEHADRSKVPELGAPPELKVTKLQRATLSNGLKVVLSERHEIPLINFWMLTDAGYAADQFAAPGTARLVSTLLENGTKSRSALEISDQLAGLGAELNAYAGVDSSVVRLSALKAKLDPSLEIYADVVLNPAFPQADFLREQKQQLASIEQEKSEPFGMALRVFPGLIYGKDHAYSEPLTGSGTTASVTKMTRDDLVKFHQTWFKPDHSTLVIVGDVKLAEIQPKLEKQFAAWKSGTTPQKKIPTVQLGAKPMVYLIDRPGSLQSVILAGHIAPPRNNPDEIAIETMNNILGGNFGARINMNLREDKHWSYGAGSAFVSARAQRPFIIYAPVQTDKTKESLAEINKEIRGILKEKPATAEELAKVKANQTLQLPGARETINQVGSAINNIVQYGLPEDYYETYPAKVRALTLADIENIEKRVLQPDHLVWVVIGDRSKIEEGVRGLGLGEIHLLNTDGQPL